MKKRGARKKSLASKKSKKPSKNSLKTPGVLGVILAILVVIRAIGLLIGAINIDFSQGVLIFAILLIILHVLSLVGLFMKKRWGPALIIVLGVIDLIIVILSGVFNSEIAFNVIFDIVIIILATLLLKKAK